MLVLVVHSSNTHIWNLKFQNPKWGLEGQFGESPLMGPGIYISGWMLA